MQGACFVNKARAEKIAKIAKIETNKHPTKSTKKKKRNKSCFFFFDTSCIQSFDIKFKVKSLKSGHVFFVLLLRIYFKLS